MLYDILPPLAFFTSFGGIIVLVSRVSMRIRKEQVSQDIQRVGQASTPVQDQTFFTPQATKLNLAKNRLALLPHMMKSSVSQAKTAITSRKNRREEQVEESVVTESISQETVSEVSEGENLISLPTSGWRHRVSNFSERFSSIKQKVSNTVPRRVRIGTPVVAPHVPPATPVLRTLELQEDTGTTEEATKPQVKLVRKKAQAEPEVIAQEAPAVSSEVQPVISAEIKPEKKRLFSLPRKEYKQNTPLSQAAAALEASEFHQAEDILVPYIVQHARDKDAYILLGKAAIGREAWDEAIEIFQQVLRIDSKTEGVQALLGYAALKTGKMTVALQSLQRAHDEDRTNVEVLQQLLTIARRMDNKVLERSVLEDMQTAVPAETQVQVKG